MKKSTSTKQTKPDKPDKRTKGSSKRPCPSGFYRNKKGICVQASVGDEYHP